MRRENRRFGLSQSSVKKTFQNVKRFGGRVVKTLRCGRRIPSSNPGRGMIFFKENKTRFENEHALLFSSCLT